MEREIILSLLQKLNEGKKILYTDYNDLTRAAYGQIAEYLNENELVKDISIRKVNEVYTLVDYDAAIITANGRAFLKSNKSDNEPLNSSSG